MEMNSLHKAEVAKKNTESGDRPEQEATLQTAEKRMTAIQEKCPQNRELQPGKTTRTSLQVHTGDKHCCSCV
jgi:hypothetical protein